MITTCGKCGKHYFEISEISLSGANYKKYMVQCTSCGVPVGVVDFFDSSSEHKGIMNKLCELSDKIDYIENKIDNL